MNVPGEVWMEPDMIVDDRALNGFMFGMKYMLLQSWGYEKWEIQVDVGMGTIHVGGELIVKVS